MTTRRDFVATAAGTGAGFMIVPRHVLGRGFQAPSDLVNIATVGISGMGAANTQRGDEPEHRRDLRRRLRAARRQARRQWSQRAQRAARRRPRRRPAEAAGAIGKSHGPSKAQLAAERDWPRQDARANLHAVRRSSRSRAEEVSRLPRDAREAEGHRRRHRRDARSHARGDRVGRDGRRQARLRAEADVLVGARGAASGEEGRREEGRDADGQPAPLGDETAGAVEYIQGGAIGDVREVHVWTNRPLGFWPQGVPRPAAVGRSGALRWDNRGVMQRLAAAMKGDERRRFPTAVVGSVPGRRAAGRVSPALSPVQLARLGRLGPGRARRHGRAPHRFSGLGAESRPADGDRDRVDAVQRRLLPERDDDATTSSRAQGTAAGQADVVRRRPDAARSRGARERER